MDQLLTPEELKAHLERLRLETFCINVLASYAERLVKPSIGTIILLAQQPYGFMTRAVLGDWLYPETDRR